MTLFDECEEARVAVDIDAFDDLYRANIRCVYAYAAARLGADDADDVTAEVFHAAVVAFRSGRSEQVTPAWLMAVTRNKVIDRWRKAERRMAKAHLLRPPDDELHVAWADDERRERVLATLHSLKHRHRSLLILHHVEAMPIADIADATGQSPSAVESALKRARAAFRRHYQRATRENP